ncbi:MAG: hypothetical protein U5K84_10450 [Alkalibacterium sp.]|nr:hypothetical protein [Alkalibacterium sp.]
MQHQLCFWEHAARTIPRKTRQATNENEETAEQTEETTFPLTLDNYTVSSDGAEFSEKEITYETQPESIVANNQGTAEMLLQLGLTDEITGVAALYGEPDESVSEEFVRNPGPG